MSAPANTMVPVSEPSMLRAWLYLVWLSWQRQARARQMVWIALLLLAFAVIWVMVQSLLGVWERWGRYGVGVGLAANGTATDRPVVMAILSSVGAIMQDGRMAFLRFTNGAVFPIFLPFLLPLWSMAFATEALGGERESNNLVWLLTRPLPRWSIYLAKFVAVLPWCLAFNVGGFALFCLVGGPPGWLALKLFWPAIVAATLAFSALFFLFGACLPRPTVFAMIYSFCLEVVLGNMPGFLKRASLGFYARSMMFEAAGEYGVVPEDPTVYAPVSGTLALGVLVGGTVLLLLLGMGLFGRMQYREAV